MNSPVTWLVDRVSATKAGRRRLHWLGRHSWIAATGKDPVQTERNYSDALLQWAEDDSYLEELCLRVGCTENETMGDSYGVPDIQDKADLIVAKLQTENSVGSTGVVPCPICDGGGEVHVPSAVPDADGWETCACCDGTGNLPTPQEIYEMRQELWSAYGDLQAAEWEISKLKRRQQDTDQVSQRTGNG